MSVFKRCFVVCFCLLEEIILEDNSEMLDSVVVPSHLLLPCYTYDL